MKTTDVNASIVTFYLKLLSGLAPEVKIDLVSRILTSMKSEIKPNKRKKGILEFYGSWESDKSAEVLIEEIRSARTFNRVIEPL